MSDLISRTARLVPYSKRPKSIASFVTAYVYEPEADEIGARLGNLFVVVEVLVSGRASEEVVDLVIQTAGEKYYNDAADELDPLARFEAAIKQTNHELSEYVGRGNAAWIGKLSAIIAVQSGGELHIAQTGSAEAFLYRGKAVSRINQSDTARPATPSKTFGSIATGALEMGDKFLLATPALVHQIPLTKLQDVICDTSPNAAIQEISQLLEGSITNRIAAIVVEITTPELAALKVRSDEPAEIELGNDETIAASAIKAAAPFAHLTFNTSRRAAKATVAYWQDFRPKIRRSTLAGVDVIRRAQATRRGRRVTLGIFIGLVLFTLAFTWFASRSNQSRASFNSYQTLYRQFLTAQTAADVGDKAGARSKLYSLQVALNALKNESEINRQLKSNPLPESEPNTVKAFRLLVSDRIDALDGLVRVSPVTVAEVGGKSARPTHFESDGASAYVIDTASSNTIAIINLATGVKKTSEADTSKLGKVENTTLSSTNDGMFILTAKPSVWFYKFANDSLSEQTLAYGQWPASKAIATYGPNLYLLGDNKLYKHTKNASGYSPPTEYITSSSTSDKVTGLAVDGWVYLLSKTGLNRYLGPVQKQFAASPASIGEVINLRSVSNGDFVIGTNPSTGRVAIWATSNDQLTFAKQLTLQNTKSVYDATYDQKLGKVFATVDNRLVSFTLKL